jgi:hypothetical protein
MDEVTKARKTRQSDKSNQNITYFTYTFYATVIVACVFKRL